eukprot:309331_1
MAHKILDDGSDKKSIDSFKRSTEIENLEDIEVGTQLYILYKDEDDESILSWYWGCVTDINHKKKNGEYWHIYHDDEYPWIDLSKDRNDWKIIEKENDFYDKQFYV